MRGGVPFGAMSRTEHAGILLVIVQFALLGWLIWPFTEQAWTPPALALVGSAVILGAWTLIHNRPGNFNIHPEPRPSGRMVTGGPYRYVRHPMYSAVLLFAAAETLAYADPWKVVCSVVLAAVLAAKAMLEERRLRELYADYAEYAARVRSRLIPGIY